MAKTAASAAGTGKKIQVPPRIQLPEKKKQTTEAEPSGRPKFTFKEQREYETIDDDIAALEEKIAFIDDQMMKNATNSAKLAELMAQKEETEAALEEKTERWVYLTDLAERIEEQNQEIIKAKELSAEEKKICGPFLLFWPKNEEQHYHIL